MAFLPLALRLLPTDTLTLSGLCTFTLTSGLVLPVSLSVGPLALLLPDHRIVHGLPGLVLTLLVPDPASLTLSLGLVR